VSLDQMVSKLAKLKEDGVVEGGRMQCSLCGKRADSRPVCITCITWVPAACSECYNWIKHNDLYDEQRDKELFYPDKITQ